MWRLLQLADSAFPTGGFAHSAGLEAAAQAGEIDGVTGVARFARDAIWQAGFGALPLARAAFLDAAALPALDSRADAFLANHVANRASRTQGRALLSTAGRVFPAPVGPVQAGTAGLKLHLSPLWGAVMSALGIPLEDAERLLLWTTARNVLSAAVRMGLAGTHEAQALLDDLSPLLDQVHRHCGALDVADLAQSSPLADLLQGTHDRLYSRLFQS